LASDGQHRRAGLISHRTVIIIIIIIIIIIKYIYIAQDREEAANALGNSYKWNRNVLSLFLNVASVMSGVRNSAGRLFHT